jgi:hypothetical protein
MVGFYMDNHPPETLKDVVPFVEEHLLPMIQQSVEVCKASYLSDPFNDSYTFGTQLWRNAWNRLRATATYEDCPFEQCGKGNEYKLKIGRFVLRNHRIDHDTQLPNGAKAAKAAAHEQLELFAADQDRILDEIDNIIIAIDADPEDGLLEVFIAPIIPLERDSNKYTWEEGQIFTVYKAYDKQSSAGDVADHHRFHKNEVEPEIDVNVEMAKDVDKKEDIQPDENESAVIIELYKYRNDKKDKEGDPIK